MNSEVLFRQISELNFPSISWGKQNNFVSYYCLFLQVFKANLFQKSLIFILCLFEAKQKSIPKLTELSTSKHNYVNRSVLQLFLNVTNSLVLNRFFLSDFYSRFQMIFVFFNVIINLADNLGTLEGWNEMRLLRFSSILLIG